MLTLNSCGVDFQLIVDFPINNGDFPVRYVSLPEGRGFFAQFLGEICEIQLLFQQVRRAGGLCLLHLLCCPLVGAYGPGPKGALVLTSLCLTVFLWVFT